MAIRIILNYVKSFFGINDVNDNIDSQFEYLLGKALDKGMSTDKLLDYGINLYGELLNSYSKDNTKRR